MFEVNRSVAVIKPKAPFLQWLKSLPGEIDPELTLSLLEQNSNALLIPPADDPADLEHFILEHYLALFQAELADWCDAPELWPADLSPQLFMQWFEIQIHPIVTDMVEEALEREHFEPLNLG